MRRVTQEQVEALEERFGEDFVFGIETSANEHGMWGGMKTFITLFSSRVTEEETYTAWDIDIYVYPMPTEDIQVGDNHVLSLESILLLTVKREEVVVGQQWDMVTEILEELEEEGTYQVLSRLSAELYHLNAESILGYFESDSYGS